MNPEDNPVSADKVYQLKQPIKRVKLYGNYLISSSADNRVRLWSADSKTGDVALLKTFKGHTGPVTKIKLEKSVLYTLSSRDEVLRAWNVVTKEHLLDFKGHEKYLCDFALSTKDEIIYTSSFDNTIIAWDMKKAEQLKQFKGHTDGVTSVKISGSHLVSGSADKTIKIWNRKTGECTNTLNGHTNFIFGIHIVDKTIYSNSQDGNVMVWGLKTGELKRTITFGAPVMKMKVNKKGEVFAQGSKVVKHYNEKGKEESCFDAHTSNILCCDWYKDYMITGSADRTIRAWSVKKGKLVCVYRGHSGPINGLAVRDNWLYSAGQDGAIRQWSNQSYLKESEGFY